jgi:zinc transport system substrate-binding protein
MGRRPTAWASIFALAALAAGCGGPAAPDDGRLRVAASVFPLADVVRQIGGEHVAVVTLLPPGATPHGFQPHARQVEELARCRLLLTVGRGMDPWAAQAAKAGGRPIRILELATGGEHADPHVWLDPLLLKAFVPQVVAELAKLDPPHKADFETRAAAFIAELDRLDAEYREALSKVKVKAFVTFHPSFTHLAKRYGLTQATLARSHAEEGGARALEHVVEFVKEHKLKAVFAEPQFPADKLAWLEEQTGARIGRLDPLGNPRAGGYDSYLAMMRSNLKALVAAMSE